MRIYLADLLYDTISINSAVPISIGYIAAYLEQQFGEQVEIKLFKFPKKLEAALKEAPPDIMGFANYTWNERLGLHFCKLAKKANPNVITIMGGPNIDTEVPGIKAFMEKNRNLDYYIINSGEEPSANLVRELLNGVKHPTPTGCATIKDGEFIYEPVIWKAASKELKYPSPYLTGWLDEFLLEPNFVPLIETNRGCPYGCVYCAWGAAALAKIQFRTLDEVFQEIDYISDHCAGQPLWMSCDANFGINERDIEIAKKFREVMDRKSYPQSVMLFDAKNTSQRNIEIASILKHKGMTLIAIQSADQDVLVHAGRGAIRLSHFQKQIEYYHQSNNKVRTDLILGLPGESYQSHITTLKECYNMGFDHINAFNMLLLNGTKYATPEFREKFGVVGKFRPIFGKYGIFGDEIVFELSENVRATKDITEKEVNDIRIIHWLMFYAWDTHFYKAILKFAHKNYNINPAEVLKDVADTNLPVVKTFFDSFKKESMDEWFETPEAMIEFYNDRKNYDDLVSNFIKLNHKHYALAYQNFEITEAIGSEIIENILSRAKEIPSFNYKLFNEVVELTKLRICKNLSQDYSLILSNYSGKTIKLILDDDASEYQDFTPIEIYRSREHIENCKKFFSGNDVAKASAKDIIRFFDSGGLELLVNSVRVLNSVPKQGEFASNLPDYSQKSA